MAPSKANNSHRPIFESQPQLQAGHWFTYVLPGLLLLACVALVVKSPSAYWIFPAATATLAMYATHQVRWATTYVGLLIWLLITLVANIGMFLWILPLIKHNLVPPF